ncbi:MAG: Lhr family ATP-dependent helicase, partial [Oryzihumus sp.]
VSTSAYARFLPAWHGVGAGSAPNSGLDGLLAVIDQLAGVPLPASAIESLALAPRVRDYSPALLDELLASGEVLWSGAGSISGSDGWVAFHAADTAPLTLAAGSEIDFTPTHRAILDMLAGGGAFFFRTLADAVGSTDDAALTQLLWDLVWAGHVTNDTLAPLRALLSGGRTAHKPRRTAPRSTRYSGRAGSLGALSGRRPAVGRPALPARSGPPTAAGRWSLLPPVEPDATVRSYAAAEVLLDRYGVVTRGSVVAEGVSGGFAGVYRVLAAAEESGRVRRGYFVEGLGAAQFATTGAVDRLRAFSRPLPEAPAPAMPEWETPLPGGSDSASPGPGSRPGAGARPGFAAAGSRRGPGGRGPAGPSAVVLAASDPANPYGAALSWPERAGDAGGHKPGRKAGALVVLVDGALAIYVERGGKTLLSWTEELPVLQAAADALALAVREGALGRLTVERADGGAVLGSDHPLAAALAEAGFHATPRGLRLRR